MTIAPIIRFAALAALLAAAVFFDLRERRIPNGITVTGLLAGLVSGAFAEGGIPIGALTGAGIALAVTFPLFAIGAIGAGDAKLFTAIGAFLGPAGLLPAGLYGAIAGGVLALAGAVRRGTIIPVLMRTRDLVVHLVTFGRRGVRGSIDAPGAVTIPYGLAIAAGAMIAWFYPHLPGVTP